MSLYTVPVSPGSSFVHPIHAGRLSNLFVSSVTNSTSIPVPGKENEPSGLQLWAFTATAVTVRCSEAQILCQEHSQDLGQVDHSRTVHVLLCVIQCVPELWERSGDDM